MNGTTSSGFNPAVAKSAQGVRTLYKAKFDELAAATLWAKERGVADEGFALEFHRSKYLLPEELKKLNLEGMYAIDLGADKYHGKTGSTTEMVVNDLYGDTVPAFAQKLAEMTTRNNKNGNLKSGPNRVTHILREAYELADTEDWHLAVAGAAMHVILMWIDAFDIKQATSGTNQVVQEIADKFKTNAEAPFSLGEYIRNMSILGVTPEEIVERVGFWATCLARLDEARANAKALYAQMRHDTFTTHGLRGICLTGEAANYFVVGCAHKDYRVLITRNNRGNVAINMKGFDLEQVYRSLALDEIGHWYLVPTGGQSVIMNGSRQYESTPPTKKKIGQLIRLLNEKAVQHPIKVVRYGSR